MRKLIFQEWLSMDGYAADKNGSVSFIESTTLNKYSDQEQLRFLDEIDTILLGAKTYQLFVDFWPDATNEQEVIADQLNTIPKTIFSMSMTTAPWGKWPAATVIASDAAEAVKKMKSEPGKNIVLWGSISIANYLMKANLIDEYHLRICPVALGAGRPLFENTDPVDFELFESRVYDSGLLLLKYRRKSTA